MKSGVCDSPFYMYSENNSELPRVGKNLKKIMKGRKPKRNDPEDLNEFCEGFTRCEHCGKDR